MPTIFSVNAEGQTSLIGCKPIIWRPQDLYPLVATYAMPRKKDKDQKMTKHTHNLRDYLPTLV